MAEIRQKNKSTYFKFPLIDVNTNSFYTTSAWGSLTLSSIECYSFNPTSATAISISNTPVQIGSTGIWSLYLTSAEMNPTDDTEMIIKLKANEIYEQGILISLTDYNNNTLADTNNRIVGIQGTKHTLDDLSDIMVSDILTGTIDNKTVEEVLEILLAYSSGRITKDGDIYTYLKQNNTDTLFQLSASNDERVRL